MPLHAIASPDAILCHGMMVVGAFKKLFLTHGCPWYPVMTGAFCNEACLKPQLSVPSHMAKGGLQQNAHSCMFFYDIARRQGDGLNNMFLAHTFLWSRRGGWVLMKLLVNHENHGFQEEPPLSILNLLDPFLPMPSHDEWG